jgi:hypothetical protein
MKKNVLVFPCGSEIGLEIYRSLQYSSHFNLIGGNSVPDHGAFVYEKYTGDIPFINQPGFIQKLNDVISKYHIDLVYPTMDSVITKLWESKDELLCDIVGSSSVTNLICYSKRKTNGILKTHVEMPLIYEDIENIKDFPVFLKPDSGYSAKGTATAFSKAEIVAHLNKQPDCLMMEYLPGKEYTIDCFTDRNRNLLFAGPRLRNRISNGISVNTLGVDEAQSNELKKIAGIVNHQLHFRGAWFFQVKRASNGVLKVMEVAARLGGSSSFFRAKGINFALLTLWDALNTDVAIIENNYEVEMDRALDNKFKIDIDYQKVFIDFDDTILINQQINIEMMAFLFQCMNEQKEIICISRHADELNEKLKKYRLENFFDKVIHLRNNELKSDYIDSHSIFIDDSYQERKKVADISGIPVFSPDMVSVLIK